MAEQNKEGSPNFSRKQKQFLKALSGVAGNVTAACKSANVSRQTYYNWLKDDDFATAVDEVNEANLDYAESKLQALIRQENPTAIIFYLKTKGKKRGYVERIENEVDLTAFEKLLMDDEDDDEDDE
jgi:hypothetical protein